MSRPSRKKTVNNADKKPKRKLSKRRLIILIILALIITAAVIMTGVVISIVSKAPAFEPKNLSNSDQTSLIFDKNGAQIGILHALENREIADSKDITENIKKSFVAVEDVRFYEHFGVDPLGIARALFKNVKTGSREGGSTITIQLTRNAFLNQENSLPRKITEAYMATKLERVYTKDEILTFYLNRIFFGEGAYGIKAAAKTYFGKELKDLDFGEIAFLVGIAKGPSVYDPYIDMEKAKYRRNTVLGALLDNKVITQEDYDKFKDAPFAYVEKIKAENKNPQTVNRPNINVTYSFPYIVDYAINELEDYGISQDAILSGGLKIYTTIDPKIQTAAESAYADPKNFPKDIDGTQVESAMVVMDPQDGSIRAMVGGRNYRTAKDLNRAWQSKRQPGSSIKPLVAYTPALEKGGYFPGTVLDDMPVKYRGGDGKDWTPTDFDTAGGGGWRGLITMRSALRDSVNVYAVKLLEKIGVDNGWKFAKDNFGLPLQDKDRVLSLALGTPEVTVLDMTSAYSAFPTGGVKAKRHAIAKVLDSKDNKLVDNTNVEKKRIMKEQTAFIMQDMMRGVVTGGTGTNAQFGDWFVAGKTGTTSMADYKRTTGTRDIWFMGYTPNYVGGVWMGFDQTTDKRNMSGNFGGGAPAELWRKVMIAAHEGMPVISEIKKPGGISYISFDTKSGLTPSNLTPPQFISRDYAIQGSLPSGTSEVWSEMEVCADTGFLPGPNTITKIMKTFLKVNRDGVDADWPDDEKQYKPPTDTCNMPPKVIVTPTKSTTPASVLSDLSVELDSPKKNALISLKVKGSYRLRIEINSDPNPSETNEVSGTVSKLPVSLPTLPKPATYILVITAIDPETNKPVLPSLTTTLTVT